MKVLVVEDSPELVETITLCLSLRWPGMMVVSTPLGGKGVEMVETESPDVVILDIGLPDIDGFEVLRQIRRFSDVPVVVVTCRGDDIDKVKGLELGADDYIAKPFSHMELLARVRAVLRRSHPAELPSDQEVLDVGGFQIDLAAHQVRRGGEVVKLTPIEYGIFTYLLRNEGRVIAHRTLLQKVWGDEFAEATDYIKKYIHRLREKLGDDANHPHIILNERGVGYKFVRPP